MSLTGKQHTKHAVEHGVTEKSDKVALVSCLVGSMKHIKYLTDGVSVQPTGSQDAHVNQLIKVATEILPKDV